MSYQNNQMQVSAHKREASIYQRGFTLMELVIAMVIIGILAAIAIPSYAEYTLRSHRSAVQAFISDLASRQTQFFLDRRVYATTVAALNVATPADIASRYTVAIAANAGPPATFQVTATPAGTQTTDRCGVLTVDQAGNRGAAATRCW